MGSGQLSRIQSSYHSQRLQMLPPNERCCPRQPCDRSDDHDRTCPVVFGMHIQDSEAPLVASGPLCTATPDPDTLAYAERRQPWQGVPCPLPCVHSVCTSPASPLYIDLHGPIDILLYADLSLNSPYHARGDGRYQTVPHLPRRRGPGARQAHTAVSLQGIYQRTQSLCGVLHKTWC